ncbi:hypothetical protein FRC12_024341 [Ceratobasidium sp. 428]|nr:hypothetical protein FRC12_024341 [Ceratobasidium sp. 428]
MICESTLCESMLRALSDPNCCPLLEELLFEKCEGIAQDAVLEIWCARGMATSGPSAGVRPGRASRRSTRGTTFQTPLVDGDGALVDVRMADCVVSPSTSSRSSGTLRSLVVRNSSTPLADMQLGERARS